MTGLASSISAFFNLAASLRCLEIGVGQSVDIWLSCIREGKWVRGWRQGRLLMHLAWLSYGTWVGI